MGVQLPSEPLTRKEQYLAKAAGQSVEVPTEPITREEAYLNAIAKGGGGGGTTNYNQLENKPQIGGVTLQGNKSASDLGLVAAETGKGLSENNYTDNDKAKVDASLNVFTGTQAEWEALYAAEKKNYQRADFTDDYDTTAIGDLTALHTSAKSSIVNAINEVKDGLTNLEPKVVTGYTAGGYCNSIGASTTVVRMGKLIVANINLEMVSGAIPNGGTLIDGLPIPKNRAYASIVSGNNMARVLCFNGTLTVDGGTTGGGWWNILLVYVVN